MSSGFLVSVLKCASLEELTMILSGCSTSYLGKGCDIKSQHHMNSVIIIISGTLQNISLFFPQMMGWSRSLSQTTDDSLIVKSCFKKVYISPLS